MRIKLDEAMKLMEKYGSDQVPIVFLNDVYLNTGSGILELTQGMKFDESQNDIFVKAGIYEFEVVFTDKLLAKLIANYPDKYRYPIGRKNLIDMDKMIDSLDDCNRMSKVKRYVLSSTEIYKKNAQGLFETVIHYGEKIVAERWNQAKSSLARNVVLDYSLDEIGILVFTILKPGDPRYASRFMKYTEVISLIVEHKKDLGVEISPDLNTDTDIYPVTDTGELLQTYIDRKPRLIVVADELDDDYKLALARVKKYDRYARMIVIKNPDPAQKLKILQSVKKVYAQNVWDM